MTEVALPERLKRDGGKIVCLVIDGLGGLPHPKTGKTELQTAATPHLDRLAAESATGLLQPIEAGITPGSGPAHLALFGYDPRRFNVGRGIYSALGIGFELQEGDVAARINFATLGRGGVVKDRRAGRISTDRNRRLVQKIRERLQQASFPARYFLETVSEHRAVLVLREPGLGARLSDTDPQRTGVPVREAEPADEDSERTAELIRRFVNVARDALDGEGDANGVLLRGIDKLRAVPSLKDRFGLTGLCLADYPMYRGVSRLLGMDVAEVGPDDKGVELQRRFDGPHDFFFVHCKEPDSAAEDGDFDRKVAALEAADRLVPSLRETVPDVLVVTGDHSTPAVMAAHSWHPVPVLIHARMARVDRVDRFDEESCLAGSLGQRPALDLMGLALAHAGRLAKFGA
jgi:2,3-bisphosphoglycerate-independent phosphoglycerate mutase